MASDKFNLKGMVFTALCASLVAVCAFISVPVGAVVFTAQTFGVAFCGYFLGSRQGTAAVIVYVLLGAVGVPVFSSFQGGLGVLLGQTGGFIIGFIPMAFLLGIRKYRLMFGALGVLCCYLIGITVFSLVAHVNFFYGALTMLPYLVKDILLVFFAYKCSVLILKRTDFIGK